MSLLAAGCAAAAAWLLCRPTPGAVSTHVSADHSARCAGGARTLGRAWPPLVIGASSVTVVPPTLVGLGGLLGVAAWVSLLLWRRRARRLEATAEAGRVREACEHLAAELAAGQPPGTALRRVADACPALASASEAFGLGGDVAKALREASTAPGRGQLRLLAAGWQVAHRTGAGLALTVERIAETLRADQQTARLVAGELASARATARLVAALPVMALAMGSGAGGSPWRFLLMSPVGLACLAGGLFLTLAGLWWIEALTGEAP